MAARTPISSHHSNMSEDPIYTKPHGTLTAKHVPSISATGVRFIRFVTSPTAHMLGMLVLEYSSTYMVWKWNVMS